MSAQDKTALDNLLHDFFLVASGLVKTNYNQFEEIKHQLKFLMIRTFTKAYVDYQKDNDNLTTDWDLEDYIRSEINKL